ncbi:MAG: DUF2203 domain-containing protein [Pyrinomonadaceae bacterium]
MKLFTVSEANEMIPRLRPMLVRIGALYERVGELRDRAAAAAAAASSGGGMEGGSEYVKTLYDLGRLMTELAETGVELKDHARGLIDFPSLRSGRVVYLCWQLGEGDQIEWWHEVEAGFAGRQPL